MESIVPKLITSNRSLLVRPPEPATASAESAVTDLRSFIDLGGEGSYHIRPHPLENTGSRPLSQSQANEGRSSSWVGDDQRMPGVVCFWWFDFCLQSRSRWQVFTRQVGSGVVVKVVLGGSYLVKYGARRLEDLAALLRSRNETKVETGPWKSRSSLCLTLMFPFGRQWKVSSDKLEAPRTDKSARVFGRRLELEACRWGYELPSPADFLPRSVNRSRYSPGES
ncbi:hypothetical protein B0T11DRAFT_284246 [Plectosphaerella cucumerina]|uniref:Uncharacterized protein n=1 Tax=Plectosphaerella cucumerina TaxID=40658 RepID=A0A8K0X2D7_9PEZI|nr:hypothetical protein B0T11DRAFT_284246 [Plectosphaerella cucumerina]